MRRAEDVRSSCSYCLSSVDKTVRFRSLPIVKQRAGCFSLKQKFHRLSLLIRTFNCQQAAGQCDIWKYIWWNMITALRIFILRFHADLLGEDELELIC